MQQTLSLSQVLTPQMRMNLDLIQAPLLEALESLEQTTTENPWLERNDEHTDPRFVRDADRDVSVPTETPSEQRDFDESDGWYNSPSTPWTHETLPADETPTSIAISVPTPYEQISILVSDLDVTRPVLEMARLIICNLDEHGLLAGPEEDLCRFLGIVTPHHLDLFSKALHAIRYQLDPAGIGARDRMHCYLIQLERLGKADSLSARLVRDGILATIKPRDLADVARKLRVTQAQLHDALGGLRRLYAHPFALLDAVTEPTRYPDLVVEQVDGEWIVNLSHPLTGRYRFRDTKVPRKKALTADMLARKDEEDPAKVLERLRTMRQNARMMVNAVEYRDRTLYEIGRYLVREQSEFLEHGDEAIKPLLQKEMAETLGLNEATVSRILKDKYLLAPAGLIPLSALFSRSLTRADGERVSNKAAMDAMSCMIDEEEDPEHPWSDREIALRLKSRGFPISRRTVTKYRQGLSIGSGADRRATGRMRGRD